MKNKLDKILRVDHAGEVGAVYIYKGILTIAKDPELLEFSKRHLATEQEHLRRIEEFLPDKKKQTCFSLENCRLSFRISSCFIWTQDSFCYH